MTRKSKVHSGTKELLCSGAFFVPEGTRIFLLPMFPALKRWVGVKGVKAKQRPKDLD
jgi:hypothetical protein